jgi:hypothetical protein
MIVHSFLELNFVIGHCKLKIIKNGKPHNGDVITAEAE